jgi:methyl-accepting chemotaxis protein
VNSAVYSMRHPSVATKLYGAVGAALVALCVMGAIAALAAGRVQSLGDALYRESQSLAAAQRATSVNLERAISDVHAAPSELDLTQLHAKRTHLQASLAAVVTTLHDAAGASADPAVRAAAGEITGAINAFAASATKVFDFAASFAQPDAIAALANQVAPAEAGLQSAQSKFDKATMERGAIELEAMRDTAGTITRIVVGLATLLVLVIAAMSYLTVSRGVVRPIVALNHVMQCLSVGEHDIGIPHSARTDEIGDMARAVGVFKQNAIEAERVAGEQASERAGKERRQAAMQQHTQDFGISVSGVMASLAAAADTMRRAAAQMSDAAAGVHNEATRTAGTAEQSSQDLISVAAAVEQLTSSVDEIARQVAAAADVAHQAVRRADASQETIRGLANSTARIGDVVHLISDIAGQTNLLALNATIEAARAGEAGRGFAVVAGEVKALAAQTAKATAEIGSQIETVRGATEQTIGAMTEISGFIGKMNEVTAAISAAVEEQSATTREIAASVQAVSHITASTARAMEHVVTVADGADAASRDVSQGAEGIGNEAETLRKEVDQFLAAVKDDSGERRRYERVQVHGAIATLRTRARDPMQAMIRDLSRGGAGFACDWTLPSGTQLDIDLPHADEPVPARVVRCNGGELAVVFGSDAAALARIDRTLDALAQVRRAA